MVPRGVGVDQVVVFSVRGLGAAALALNRKLSLPVSRMDMGLASIRWQLLVPPDPRIWQ